MSGRVRRSSMILAVTAMFALAPAAAAAASPAQDPVPIGPNEYFSGLVNGSTGITAPAEIMTACFGPTTPGETGHPLPGQTVEVEPAVAPVSNLDIGYTGTARSITAYVAWPYPAAVNAPELVATFSSYFVPEPIPVTLTVPCAGTGAMLFVPTPGATNTGRTATVRLDFVPQP